MGDGCLSRRSMKSLFTLVEAMRMGLSERTVRERAGDLERSVLDDLARAEGEEEAWARSVVQGGEAPVAAEGEVVFESVPARASSRGSTTLEAKVVKPESEPATQAEGECPHRDVAGPYCMAGGSPRMCEVKSFEERKVCLVRALAAERDALKAKVEAVRALAASWKDDFAVLACCVARAHEIEEVLGGRADN